MTDSHPRSWRSEMRSLITHTVATCMRHRVTGLAAEAAFFAILSLPPLIFALAGSLGFVFERLDSSEITELREAITDFSGQALTPDAVEAIIEPTLDQVFQGGRYDVVSIGFLLALWSGSRAMNVVVDTITIMYGLAGHRGIVRTRATSFVLYLLGMVVGVVTLPLIAAGPSLVRDWLPGELEALGRLYWPIVMLLGICFLSTLYHFSVPVRNAWRFNLPGAAFTLVVAILGSVVLRAALISVSSNSTSIYGPLAAPIAVLLWLYLLSLTVLVGAALNAAVDQVWPQEGLVAARGALRQRLGSAVARRLRATARGRAPENEANGAS